MNHYLKTPTVRWNEACKYLRSMRRLNGPPAQGDVFRVADEYRLDRALLLFRWKYNDPKTLDN